MMPGPGANSCQGNPHTDGEWVRGERVGVTESEGQKEEGMMPKG